MFGIKKTGSTSVVANVVVSDGYAIKDVERALNKSVIQEYVQSKEEDMEKLWVMLIGKVEGRLPLEKEEIRIAENPVLEHKIEPNAKPNTKKKSKSK